jgi:hypothetical protein
MILVAFRHGLRSSELVGRGRIPPDQYLVWAEVLGVEPKFFVKNLLRSYDPVTYSILFGKSKPQK